MSNHSITYIGSPEGLLRLCPNIAHAKPPPVRDECVMSCDKVLVTIISLNLGSQYRVEPTEIWVLITAAGADRGGSTQVLKAPVLKVV